MKRINRVEYYLALARVASMRSTCSRAKVGAVLVDLDTNRLVSMGYNGSAKGAPHCTDVGCLIVNDHCVRTIHAEMNALIYLDKNYEHLALYCTHEPCYQCLKALIAANVKEIYFLKSYPDEARDKIFKEYNFNVIGMSRQIKMTKVIGSHLKITGVK